MPSDQYLNEDINAELDFEIKKLFLWVFRKHAIDLIITKKLLLLAILSHFGASIVIRIFESQLNFFFVIF